MSSKLSMTEVNAASLRASPACTFAATFLVGEVEDEVKNTFSTLFLTLPIIVEAPTHHLGRVRAVPIESAGVHAAGRDVFV